MTKEQRYHLFDQMENESRSEILRKHSLMEIETAIHVAEEKIAAHGQEWFGMEGTCWEREDDVKKRRMLRKLLWCYNAKGQIMYASLAA